MENNNIATMENNNIATMENNIETSNNNIETSNNNIATSNNNIETSNNNIETSNNNIATIENNNIVTMENSIITDKHILAYDSIIGNDIEILKQSFCGLVMNCETFSDMIITSLELCDNVKKTIIYLCGNIGSFNSIKLNNNYEVFVIKELSYNYENYKLIRLGEVPIKIQDNNFTLGIYFRNMFDTNKDYFKLIANQHQFQNLTESNKPSNAFRKGIYITNVEENNNETTFNLLRCSSNFDGPTVSFKDIDREIIDTVNKLSQPYFKEQFELNHVLAQIYENKCVENNDGNISERKAKIKEHSDKTKDMPTSGLLVFTTFYKDLQRKNNVDFDNYYNNTSTLTKLKFRLKNKEKNPTLKEIFNITLYPNSVLLIPLSSNRLYTHEIIPSCLPIQKIPIRLGYVIRCSKQKAVHKNGETFIVYGDELVKLEQPDNDGVAELKKLYYEENCTDNIINYKNFNFSLNNGDYLLADARQTTTQVC